jgi:hypothetical protein
MRLLPVCKAKGLARRLILSHSGQASLRIYQYELMKSRLNIKNRIGIRKIRYFLGLPSPDKLLFVLLKLMSGLKLMLAK